MPKEAAPKTPAATAPADDENRTDAADAAVAETDADESATVRGSFAGVAFAFARKRLDSVQFRRFMQRGNDLVALEWLLGVDTFNKIVGTMADEDGVTDMVAFLEIYKVIGEASGSGNSESSSG